MSILEVIDTFFHRDPAKNVLRLSDAEIEALGDAVHAFYASAKLEAHPGAVYLGGWHSGYHSLFDPHAGETLSSLLYYDAVVIHDPLAEYFKVGPPRLPELKPLRERRRRFTISPLIAASSGTRTWELDRSSPELARETLANILERLESVRPAIEAGIVLPRAVWPAVESRIHELASSIRNDVRDDRIQREYSSLIRENDPPLSWDHVRGLVVTPEGGVLPADEPFIAQTALLYMAKSIAIADATNSRYAPYTSPDFRLFAAKTESTIARNESRVAGEVIRSIGGLLLPDLNLPVPELVKIRENEAAFNAWRSELGTLSRDYGGLPSEQLHLAIADRMAPQIHEVDTALENSSVLRRSKDGATEIVVTALAAGGLGAAIGVDGPVETAVMTGGPAIATWILKMLSRPMPAPGKEILWSLRKSVRRKLG